VYIVKIITPEKRANEREKDEKMMALNLYTMSIQHGMGDIYTEKMMVDV
jgi:hypothetical protein